MKDTMEAFFKRLKTVLDTRKYQDFYFSRRPTKLTKYKKNKN